MAHQPYTLEILTPEGHVFSGEVEFVSTRTESGSIGLYARHQPLLALLAPTELRVTTAEGEQLSFAQGEGYVQVSPGRVLVLVEEALTASELDAAELEERISDAQARIEAAPAGSEALRVAERDRRRASTFLELARAAA